MTDSLVTTTRDDRGVVTITLNRPEARNALSPALVAALKAAFAGIDTQPGTRAVVLAAAGSAFCAGGDIAAMEQMATFSYEENLADSQNFDEMYRIVDECPCPVIARVNGAAMGGGAGLVACADIAVAVESASFALSEVRVGIIPAVVGTYVTAKIGLGWARRLLITGERFDAATARAIGLVHEVTTPDALDATVEAMVGNVLAGRPSAQRMIKTHLAQAFGEQALDRGDVRALAIESATKARMSDEGRRGLGEFLRRPRETKATKDGQGR
ncbi:MAG: enoyl-CoA hydratase-related protein [Acidimicrobiales bacterium]